MGAPDHQLAEKIGKPEASAILTAGELIERHRATAKRTDVLHAKPYVILRDAEGKERVEYVDEQFFNPTFRKGTVKLDDGKSFIAYFACHATPASTIYASLNPARFVAVLDEHPPTGAMLPQAAAWREFRAEFTPTHSPEWNTWATMDRKAFESTEKFAYFLEDNLPDIVEPSGAELMEVALNFRVNQAVAFSAAQRLSDGHAEIAYTNQVDGSSATRAGTVRIPETFKIEIPVFAGVGARRYAVDARFRYRLNNGALKLWYELVRPHKVLELAFNDLWVEVGDGTRRTILLGKPE